MKKLPLAFILAILTSGSLLSNAAFAGGPGGHQDPQQWQPQHGGHQDQQQLQPQHGGHPGEQGRQNDQRMAHDQAPRSVERDRFAWQGHDFRRGYPAPQPFRGEQYRVSDWRDRGLRQPPRGEHWAYIDGNYVLIAAATGIITSIILNNALGE